MRRASADVDVDAFIVRDIAQPSMLKKWCALFNEACIVSPAYFASGGASGPCIAYKSPLPIATDAWVSPRFKTLHPALYRVLVHAVGKPASKWKIEADATAWAARAAKKAVVKNTRCLALITPADRVACDKINKLKFAMDAHESIRFLGKPDEARSRHGMCRR